MIPHTCPSYPLTKGRSQSRKEGRKEGRRILLGPLVNVGLVLPTHVRKVDLLQGRRESAVCQTVFGLLVNLGHILPLYVRKVDLRDSMTPINGGMIRDTVTPLKL